MSQRLTKKELDAQFELFLKESVSDDSVDLGSSDKPCRDKTYHKSNQKPAVSWWPDDEHVSEAAAAGEPAMMAAGNLSDVGLDTQEEENEEKARFYAQLEEGAVATLDYSALNRELDSTSSTAATDHRKDASLEQNKDHQSNVRVTETVGESRGSPLDSKDSEEEEVMKEPLGKPKMSTILARVSLYDSLDEDEDRQLKSLNKGQTNAQSGASDIEALQEAYRQIHTVEDSDETQHVCVEEEKKKDRPGSSLLLPQQTQPSLQLASTDESDLPTAEELMRPVLLEHDQIRGFTLQPVRSMELDIEKKTQSVERTFPVLTESALKHPGKSVPAAGLTGTSSGLRSYGSPSLELTWTVKEEVDRLMKDENKNSSQTSPRGKAKKQLASCGSSVFHPAASSDRRPTVAPVRSKTVHERAVMNYRSAMTNKAVAASKTQSLKTTRNQDKDKGETAESSVKVSSELVAVLQQQTDSSSGQSAVQEPKGPEESRLAQPHPQMSIRSVEEFGQKKRRLEIEGLATDEKLKEIDKEIKEQERLIKGYQQENEKMCLQMKAQQAKSKATEEAMFNETQRLMNELDFTREMLKEASRPVGSVCMMNHTQSISDLLSQIHSLQRNEAKLSQENQRLKQEKQLLEVDMMKKEREAAKDQTTPASEQTLELHVLEDRHREEVAALKKKLQWFSKNQELLDQDVVRLKAATVEILQLKEQVENLKKEVVKRSNEQQRKARDRSADTQRIKDLERQVQELKQILRTRNPNSLPALIYAAATDVSNGNAEPSSINALLEARIQRLEAELESHDEEAKRSLQAMEQQFHRIKLRYEQQISELEQQLTVAEPGSEPWKSRCQSLEEKLQHVQDSHQETEKYLRDQIESLQQQQLKNKEQPSPGRHQRQAEAAFGARIERLNQELASKTKRIQELSRTVERLQKERRNMLFASRPEPSSAHTKQRQVQTRTVCSTVPEGESFPAAQCEKTYQPMVFTGSHISEVLQQNEALKQQVELLQLHRKQEKEVLQAEAVRAEEELSKLKECCAEQLSSMRKEHLRVLDHLHATHALEHSSSKVAELTNELNSKEIAMKHLQEQLKELQGCKEALIISQSKEDTLQKQLTKLLQELKEAKDAQSSEARLLCELEKKIFNMELRHKHREQELQQVMGGLWQMSAADLQSEVDHWRHLAQDRSRELNGFRTELDSILDILRHLQKQGVALSNP
ncbi:centrosomal protein of 162 kDa isoform X2 [Austrofundulus limnaeus]|uniref:Centrosomal protein of 162 kDa n=1 Tax=Austrofundulus limnaeus TaxID=52670 RepID=A0A2I4CGJ3_AUSLI|nr:PREDICTED: centrosomal protein of 162 kDa isoform X2 [Austrofundulus limnaeus]